MKIYKLGALALAASAFLMACGGGDNASSTVVAVPAGSAVTVDASTGSAVAQSLSGQTISFSSGVPELGISGAAALTLTAPSGSVTPTFAITSSGGSASGNLGFGSCIFTVTTSTFPAGHPLAVGQTIRVSPCAITLTASTPATGQASQSQVTVKLGTTTSAAVPIKVAVDPTTNQITLVTPSGATIALPPTVKLPTKPLTGA